MAFFTSSTQLTDTLGDFFRLLGNDAQMGPKLLAAKLVLCFRYTNPDAVLTIDLRGTALVVSVGEPITPPDVAMSMEAEIAHQYWLGKISLPIALARRQIRAKGSIPKILALLPIIKRAHQLYPEFIRSRG